MRLRRDMRCRMHTCYVRCIEGLLAAGHTLTPGKAYMLGFRAGAEYGKDRTYKLLSQPSEHTSPADESLGLSVRKEGANSVGDAGELSKANEILTAVADDVKDAGVSPKVKLIDGNGNCYCKEIQGSHKIEQHDPDHDKDCEGSMCWCAIRRKNRGKEHETC